MRTLAWAAAAAIALVAAACSDSHEPTVDYSGAWLSGDATTLIAISSDRRVEIRAVEGPGLCVTVGVGSVGSGVLIATDGTRYPIDLDAGELVVDDPVDGLLTGRYGAVSYGDVCFLDAPYAGENGERAIDLFIGPLEVAGDRARRTVEIEVPPDAIAFAIYVFGAEVGSTAAPTALRDPGGDNLFLREPDLGFCVPGFCSALVPKNGAISVEPGVYRLGVAGPHEALADLDARGVIRRGPLPAASALPVRPIVASERVDGGEIDAILARMAETYAAESGLVIDVLPAVVADASLSRVPADFAHPDVVELISFGDADALNLIFVDRVTGVPGLLGIAAGIPASLGLHGPYNGVLVALDAHRFLEPPLDTDFVGDTATHEVGHAVGLYHTTEESGLLHDPIVDTPECLPDADLSGDAILTADECEDLDGFNFMFWTPMYGESALAVQHDVSEVQRLVAEHVVVGVSP